jgi:hypothetical protein
MKIEKLHLNNLRNDEHFQFMTDFAKLVRKFTPAAHLVAQRRGRAAAEREREDAEAAALAGVDVETWRAMQRAAAAAEKASKLVAAGSAKAVVVEQAEAEAVEVVGAK